MNPALALALGALGLAAAGGVYLWFNSSSSSSAADDELAALDESTPPTPPADTATVVEEPPVTTPLTHRLGANFTLGEFVRSAQAQQLGINNMPTPAAFQALGHLVRQVLQPLRQRLGVPVTITSGYRSPQLNRAVGGASESQHVRGEAADIKSDMASIEITRRIWNGVREGWLDVDQVILYAPERGGHVHLSYTTRRPNRGQFLYAPAGGGYRAWSPT